MHACEWSVLVYGKNQFTYRGTECRHHQVCTRLLSSVIEAVADYLHVNVKGTSINVG